MSVTIGTSTTSVAIQRPTMRKIFTGLGLIWGFYSDGTDAVFQTRAAAGGPWSGVSIMRLGVPSGGRFAVWYSPALNLFCYVVTTTVANEPLYFRMGTLTAAGAINWLAVEQIAVAAVPGDLWYSPSIALDTSGYAFISYGRSGAWNDVWVTKNANNDGTWVTDAGHPFMLGPNSGVVWRSTVVPFTAGRMCAIYQSRGILVGACARRWTGAAWGAERQNGFGLFDGWSATSLGDTAYLAGPWDWANVSSFVFDVYDYTADAWAGAAVIGADTAETGIIYEISVNPFNGDLYVFTGRDTNYNWGIADHIYYWYLPFGGVWAGPTDWLDESVDDLTDGSGWLQSFYEQRYCLIGLLYMTLLASPFNIRYNELYVPCAEMAAGGKKSKVIQMI